MGSGPMFFPEKALERRIEDVENWETRKYKENEEGSGSRR